MSWVRVDSGLLQIIINAFRRDAEQGKLVRGEMADEIVKSMNSMLLSEQEIKRLINRAQRTTNSTQEAMRELVSLVETEYGITGDRK